MKLSIQQYLAIENDELEECLSLLNVKDYKHCEAKLKQCIFSICSVLKERPWGKYNDFYNNILVCGIICKCVLEFLEIIKMTKDNKWVNNNKAVEDIWYKMLNCKDRLYYVKEYISETFFKFMSININNLESVFHHNYGDSFYMSVEFIYDPICSICFKDLRSCEHEQNRIYNGELCKVIRRNLDMESSNVVKQPHDFRCRIWPWKVKNEDKTGTDINMTIESILFSLFTVDDFLYD